MAKRGRKSKAEKEAALKAQTEAAQQEAPSVDLQMQIAPTDQPVRTKRPYNRRKGVESTAQAPVQAPTPPSKPLQFVASGVKRTQRGRKRGVVFEHNGWGIYNVRASYLVQDFFTRKTDVINALEQSEKKPWAQIKNLGEYVPVRVRITLDQRDLKSKAAV